MAQSAGSMSMRKQILYCCVSNRSAQLQTIIAMTMSEWRRILASRCRQSLALQCPMQLPTQWQWWSIRQIHRPHRRQWQQRCGFNAQHTSHFLPSSPLFSQRMQQLQGCLCAHSLNTSQAIQTEWQPSSPYSFRQSTPQSSANSASVTIIYNYENDGCEGDQCGHHAPQPQMTLPFFLRAQTTSMAEMVRRLACSAQVRLSLTTLSRKSSMYSRTP